MEGSLVYVLVTIAGLGVAAQWVGWRFQFPAIILLTISGLLAGPVFGLIEPSKDLGELLRPIISLCVAVILFDGGLSLRFNELREAIRGVKRLVSVGAILSFFLGSLAAHYIGTLSWPVSLVFGAITVVTGPTVIIPMLRQAMLNRRTASYLKWEGIINDPIGALLAVLIFQYFVFTGTGGGALGEVVLSFAKAIMVAALLGIGGGHLISRAFSTGQVPEFLKAPVLLGLVVVLFALSNAVQHEAGLLTVTVLGLVIGNSDMASLEDLRRFKESITILLVSSVFVLLAADLDAAILARLDWHSIALILAMMFIVRPLVVQISALFTDMSWRDRILVGWIAPRGIVAAAISGVFAPDLIQSGYQDAALLVPLVFALIFSTVLAHGMSIRWLAKRLDLAHTVRNGVLVVGSSPWAIEFCRTLKEVGIPCILADTSWHRLRPARLAGLRVYFGEILSEHAEENLEFNQISVLLAATSNDAYNALVCNSFGPFVGTENVYQLAMYGSDSQDPKSVTSTLRGRMAFGEGVQFEELWRRHDGGWRLHKTRLTEGYSYEDLQDDWPDEVLPMLALEQDGSVQIHSPKWPLNPKIGDTVIYYASEETAEAANKKRDKRAELSGLEVSTPAVE